MTKKKLIPIQVNLSELSLEVLAEDIFLSTIRSSSHVLHEHAIHELYYIESGEMEFECNGSRTLTAGDLFVISAGSAHRVIRYSEDMQWFHFRFRILNESLKHDIPTYYFPGFRPTVMFELIQAIRSYSAEIDSDMAEYRLRCRIGILLSFVLESLIPIDKKHASAHSIEPFRSSKIIHYSQIDTFLYDRCSGVVRLEELARYLNYSKVQTARLVSECCGMSFSEKLREIRIRLAKQLLTTGELTISEIAERCGYQTRQGFEAAFKQAVGTSPYVFRKQVRNQD